MELTEVRMRVKAIGPIGGGTTELEKALQKWLDDNPNVVIHHFAQSQDGAGWITLTILYTVGQK